MSPNAFRSVVDIDLLGTYHVLRAAYPCCASRGAAVINVSAPQAFLPMALQSHVCAAKAGVDMLTRVLAGYITGVVLPVEGGLGAQRRQPSHGRAGPGPRSSRPGRVITQPLQAVLDPAVPVPDGLVASPGWSRRPRVLG
jgi:hypothetical protein